MRTLLLLPVLLASAIAHAQNAPTPVAMVDSASLHIIRQEPPIYPPIAAAAHVSGPVKLQLEIGTNGHVKSTKVVSGPPMLIGAAQDSVRSWRYEPVVRDGTAVTVTTVVTINFGLRGYVNPNDEKIASQFFPLQQACIKVVSSNVDPAQQADVCKQAADVAQNFSTQERFIERRSAFVYASTALRRNKDPKDALDYANRAVAVVEQGHDDGSGSSAAYGVRAQAEALLGNQQEASDDLTKAEDFERSAIIKMGGATDDFVKHQYIPVLKGILNAHAQILTALGQAKEAEMKTAEASKL